MENYEQKYNKLVNAIKALQEANPSDEGIQNWVNENVSELKESENKRIRKTLIEYFNAYPKDYYGELKKSHILAWLEEQGEIDKTSYDIAEKEKYDFVSGQFIECRKSFNEFKEDNSYWLEYVGNDTYIGRSDNILNKRFHITPRQLYRLFTQQHCPKEDSANEGANAPTEYGKYVDECLNEASKHFFSEGEDKYSVADLFYAGVRCGKSWLEKQGETSSNVHYWTEEEIEPIISDYLRGAEHYGGMIGRLRCLKPKSEKRYEECKGCTLTTISNDLKKILSKAVSKYGIEAQTNLAVEEMGELIVAINHYRRGRVGMDAVQEEIADVMIAMYQLAMIYGELGVSKFIEQKTQRLEQRLKKLTE